MRYKKFVPDMYSKNVSEINYQKLKSIGIKCLLFDLDNTLLSIGTKKISKDIKNLLVNLS